MSERPKKLKKLNLMKKVRSIFDLVRFGHAIIFVISFLIGIYLFSPKFSKWGMLIIPSLVILFSEMGSFALNDALDVESDKLNLRMDRPLVRGDLSREFAFRFGWIFIILSTLLAFVLGTKLFLFVLFINILAITYDYILKDILLLGNLYIAFCMSAPFLFAYLILYNTLATDPMLLFIASTTFLFGLSREIAKDIMDMDGDSKIRHSKTLPILIGPKKTLTIVFAFFFIAGIYSIMFSTLFSQTLGTNIVLIFSIATIVLALSIIYTRSTSYKLVAKKIRSRSMLVLMLGIVTLIIIAIYGGH